MYVITFVFLFQAKYLLDWKKINATADTFMIYDIYFIYDIFHVHTWLWNFAFDYFSFNCVGPLA